MINDQEFWERNAAFFRDEIIPAIGEHCLTAADEPAQVAFAIFTNLAACLLESGVEMDTLTRALNAAKIENDEVHTRVLN